MSHVHFQPLFATERMLLVVFLAAVIFWLADRRWHLVAKFMAEKRTPLDLAVIRIVLMAWLMQTSCKPGPRICAARSGISLPTHGLGPSCGDVSQKPTSDSRRLCCVSGLRGARSDRLMDPSERPIGGRRRLLSHDHSPAVRKDQPRPPLDPVCHPVGLLPLRGCAFGRCALTQTEGYSNTGPRKVYEICGSAQCHDRVDGNHLFLSRRLESGAQWVALVQQLQYAKYHRHQAARR